MAEQTQQEEDDGVDRSLQGEGGSIDDRQSHAAAATIEETRGGGESLIYSSGSSYAQAAFTGDRGRRLKMSMGTRDPIPDGYLLHYGLNMD